jgi:hypothetical protein
MNMIEKVARAIQQAREQNGGPPYDGLDAILGERGGRRAREALREEAIAAIGALKLPDEAWQHPELSLDRVEDFNYVLAVLLANGQCPSRR